MALSKKNKDQAIFHATGADKDGVARSMGVDPDAEPDVYAFLCKALDAPLPHPWTEHADKKGRIFFWNPASRHSSWQHPLAASHKALLNAYRRVSQEEDKHVAIQAELEAFQLQVEEEIGKWRQSIAPDGKPYFYQIGTQLTRWDNPRDELMSHMELRVRMLDELAQMPPPDAAEAGAELDRTQIAAVEPSDTSAIVDESQSPAASPTTTLSPGGGPLLSIPDEPADGKNTIRSFLGFLSRRGRARSASQSGRSASEASDSAASGSGRAASPNRSFRNLFGTSRSKRSRSADKNRVGKPTAKELQKKELAAQRVTRAARRWLRWTRAKKYEAALTVQRMFRGWKGRKEYLEEWERQEEARRRADALPPDLEEMGRTLLEVMTSPLGKHRNRIAFERSQLLALQGDPDLSEYIRPDEIALQHGMDFGIPMDKAIFNIIRPLLLRPLPVPWQVLKREHGRVDFYHAGIKEERRRHPLHAFFGEVITFLRAHVHTNVAMTEPMTAQVFREASPQTLRQRLGVWEGPYKDTSEVGGVRFKRLVPGTDKDCAEGPERVDDPRLEAASNATARIAAWLHLWIGFAPEEPFPFLEGRISALAAQISENVVVAPGAASEALLAQLAGAAPLAVLAAPAPPVLDPPQPEVLQLTAEEEALQPIVTGTLGKAYGSALAFIGRTEAEALEGARPQKPVVVREEESEGSYTDIAEDDEYEDSFADEEEEDEEEEEYETESESEEKDELSEDISAATTAVTPQDGRRPMADLDALESEIAEEEPEEQLPKEVESFLPGYKEQGASNWASRMLRPLTPTEERKEEEQRPSMPGSPGKRPWHRVQPRTGEVHLWGENKVLADATERLELKEPRLADGGQGPAAPAASADLATSAGLSASAGLVTSAAQQRGATALLPKEPLSPNNRERAAEALSQLAEPMQATVLSNLRKEQQERVDSFSKSLAQANDLFDQFVEADTDDGQKSDRRESGPRTLGETDKLRSGRSGLKKPHLPADLLSEFAECSEEDVRVLPGRIARANSPSKGQAPAPPHLAGALSFSQGIQLCKAWPLTRSSSTGDIRVRHDKQYEQPRPRSSNARARKGFFGLLPAQRFSNAAEEAAVSCRRFLSRTCGTMQLALATFDSTGDGKFNRWEWEEGLKKLGYEATYDVQEIFTILDKRQHHVLTLSDLLDYYRGRPISEGLPKPGLSGLASEIMHEAVLEAVDPVITRVLAELLEKELLAPRGPPFTLPNVKNWLKKQEQNRKNLARDPRGALTIDVEDDKHTSMASSLGSTRKSGRGRRQDGTTTPHSLTSSSPKHKSPGRRLKKNITKFQAVGQLIRRKARRTSPSIPGTPLSSTATRRRGLMDTAEELATGGSGNPDARTAKRKGKKVKAKSSGRRLYEQGSQSNSRNMVQLSSSPAGLNRVFQTYEGTQARQSCGSSVARIEEWEREKLLPWMPRPTEDICKTYGHIFRLLNDPRTKKMSQKPQKRSVHVSVPRMPAVPPGRGGSLGSLEGGAPDGLVENWIWMRDIVPSSALEFSQPLTTSVTLRSAQPPTDPLEGLAPLPSMKSGKRVLGAKSSPDLFGGHNALLRPRSAGSQASEDDPDRMRVSLPKLITKGASPMKASHLTVDPLGPRRRTAA